MFRVHIVCADGGMYVARSDRLLSATAVDFYLSYRSDKGSFTASMYDVVTHCVPGHRCTDY